MSDFSERSAFRHVWLWPLALAVSSTFGLASALVGDGIWDMLAWLSLAPPLIVSSLAWGRSRAGRSREPSRRPGDESIVRFRRCSPSLLDKSLRMPRRDRRNRKS